MICDTKTMDKLLCYVVLAILTALPECSALAFTTRPNNTAAIKGTEVTLTCAFDEEPSVDWRWYEGVSAIFFEDTPGGHVNQDMYSLEQPTGYDKYNLVVDTSDTVVASTYHCEGSTTGLVLDAYADILLLEDDPKCIQRRGDELALNFVEGEDAEISCEVTYHSGDSNSWIPEVEWIGVDNTVEDMNGNVLRSYFIVRDLTHAHNGQSFTCTARFGGREPPEADGKHDDNAPAETFTCNTSLVVNYPPRDLAIFVCESSSFLVCVSISNPPVHTYQWTINGEVMKHTEQVIWNLTSLEEAECCATNTFRGEDHTTCTNRSDFEDTKGSGSVLSCCSTMLWILFLACFLMVGQPAQ